MELHAFEELADFTEKSEQALEMAVFPPVTPPGMAYVPYQQWGKTYDAEKGLCCGTMFPVLDYPFGRTGGDCAK